MKTFSVIVDGDDADRLMERLPNPTTHSVRVVVWIGNERLDGTIAALDWASARAECGKIKITVKQAGT